ncbi:MAG: regulatory domain of in-like proprotein convertase [Bacteroidetes bacterium]|nr:regulatory domain of in-like proprotein convertase [Bacteroidota bacterium]
MKKTSASLSLVFTMRYAGLLAVTFAFFNTLDAQNFTWAKPAPVPAGIIVNGLLRDNSDNTYLYGARYSSYTSYMPAADTTGSYFAKFDSSGNPVLSKQWKTSFFITTMKFYNNRFYATGYFNGNILIDGISLVSSGAYDGFTGEIDLNGNFQWIKPAGGVNWDFSIGLAIDPTNNNIVVTGGTHLEHPSGIDSSKIFIHSYDSGGNLDWTKELDFFSSYHYGPNLGKELFIDSAGNYTLLALRAGNHPVSGPAPFGGYILINLDANRDTVWTHNFTKSTYNYSLETISNLCSNGTELKLLSHCERYGSNEPYDYVYTIAKSTGIYSGSYTNNSRAYNDIISDGLSGYLCGNEGASVYYGNPYNDFGYEVLKKTDEDNLLLWEKRFNNSQISYLNKDRSDLVIFGFLGADTIQTQNGDVSNTGSFIARLTDDAVNINTIESPASSFTVYPNPSVNIFNALVHTTGLNENAYLTLRNAIGQIIMKRVILSSELQREEFTIDLSHHPKGIYFVQLESGKLNETRKLVLQ